jgi:release factor glutamine methyltransferase
MKMNQRRLLPYEKNLLLKHGFSLDKIDQYKDMPVEYIVGKAEFCDLEFIVDKNVLIPRLETEELVNLVLKDIKKNKLKNLNIADVGCGSGVIGLTLLKKIIPTSRDKNIYLYLSDISEKALKIAENNYQKLFKDKKNIKFIKSNLLSNYPQDIKFDYIVANLPYIPSSRLKKLDKSVTKFEPQLALDGGQDGTTLINKLLKQAKTKLIKNGKIFLEIDEKHSLENFVKIGYKSFFLYKDSFNENRFIEYE